MRKITSMKKFMKNFLKVKKVRLIVLGLFIGTVGIVLATTVAQAQFKGLINFFGKVTGQASVAQSIKLDDRIYGAGAAWTYTAKNIAAGETVFNGPHFIRNTASVPIKVTLETDPNPDNLNPSVVDRVWHNVQITTGPEYKRNPSFFKGQDGAYWLFFAQDTNSTQNGKGCDAGGMSCDNDAYEVFYVVSLDKGETWSAPIKMPNQSTIGTNRRDISAFQDKSGKIWVFVASGQSGLNHSIYYYTSSDNGATWVGPQQVPGINGGHISALEVNNYIVLFYEEGSQGIKLVYTKKNAINWKGPVLVDSRGGVPKAIHSNDGKIRVVWTKNGQGIYMSSCNDNNFGTASNWSTTAGPIAETVGYFDYDPYLYQDSYGKYWLFYAPWDNVATQWISYVTSTDGSVWSQPKILMKRSNLWNFWPVVSQDDNGNMLIFYASENNYNNGRVNGNIWLAKSGNWWNGNVPMKITIPANSWVGVDISNVFKDDTGASTYKTVTTVKK